MAGREESPATFLGGRGSITYMSTTYNGGCDALGCRQKLLSGSVACGWEDAEGRRDAIWRLHDALATEPRRGGAPAPVERRSLGVGYSAHW